MSTPIDLDNLPDDIDELKRIIYDLQFERDITEAVIDIVKKDPSVDPKRLPIKQKVMVVDAIAKKRPYSISSIISSLHLARASFYYHKKKTVKDRDEQLRKKVRAICADNPGFGYRRIKAVIDDGAREKEVGVSEKRIRRIMKEEGLQVSRRRKNTRYRSYKKACDTSDLPNIPLRHDNTHAFIASCANKLWVTDVTEFLLPNEEKCYLSAILDCFDSSIVGYRASRSLTAAKLTDPSLKSALRDAGKVKGLVIHSDRGCHYHARSWIEICDSNELIRSMSRKGCSPDNARMEGFFARLKMEFFDTRDWRGYKVEEFIEELYEWIKYYNERRPKMSLGWRSPEEYRRQRSDAA